MQQSNPPARPPKFARQILVLFLSLLALAACRPAGESELPVPALITKPPPATAYQTLAALAATDPPPRDLVALAERLGGAIDVPRTVEPPPAGYQVGAKEDFWVKNRDTNQTETVTAILSYQSEQLNLWVQEGERVNERKLQAAAAILEAQVLPTNRAFFGEEWQPGVDHDPRLNILHVKNLGEGVIGFFSAADEYVAAVNPYSNEREMLYTSLRYAAIGSDAYYDLIAHEMQHMIHWHTDLNEATWLNEGMSVLAAQLNGYPTQSYQAGFAARPDVQLNNFSYEGPAVNAQYGAAYYLAAYFLDRFGEAATQALLRHQENGITGIEATLAELGQPLAFDELVAQWAVANYLDGLGQGSGIYQYHNLDLPPLATAATHSRFPAGATSAVFQYGTDYIQLRSDQPVTVVFTGTQQTQLLDTTPYSGSYFWTTVPGDKSDMTLTGAFDLSGLTQATLSFQTWYDVEEGWDYAYVTVSDDGGATWHILPTNDTTLDNPQGNSYGPALTGRSGPPAGDTTTPAWIPQTADLTPFAGGPLLIRFEYVTDDTVNLQGWALDNITIPELGYLDDVEAGPGVWTPAGFVRHTNQLPQTFIIQAILFSENEVRLEPLQLDENQRGRWELPLDEQWNEAILVVMGNTPFTSHRAAYQYQIDER